MKHGERRFNLLDEPWLPVRMKDGATRWLGLLDVFGLSADIRALAETRPPSLVAEYRLLLAIVHRAMVDAVESWQDSERVRWYQDGMPLDAIRAYLEKWRHSFWLFDSERPFMQVAALATAEETRDRKKPWTQISLGSANGNTPTVFDHALDQSPEVITLRDAVAHLLGFLQFTPGGLVKVLRDADKAGALVNTAAVMPIGDSLAQTLVLAVHPAPLPDQVSHDLPAWERPPLTIALLQREPRLPTGPNDRYTRMSRAVLLCPGPAPDAVSMLWFAAGEALGEDPQQPDPMACFREGASGLVRVSFVEGRSVWRDLPALLPTPGDGGRNYKPAATLSAAESLLRRLGRKREHQPLLVAGLASDQAKLLRWRAVQFTLPEGLLTDPERALELKLHLALCEQVYSQLRYLAGKLHTSVLPDPSSKDTKSRARDLIDNGPLSALYFAEAERGLWALMEYIGRDASEEAERFWQQGLRQAALGAWRRVADNLGMSADALRAEARCRRRLHATLGELLPMAASSAQAPISEGASA